MDAASLIVFMTLVMRLLPPLKQLSQTPTTAQQSFAAAERLFEVLDQPTRASSDRGTRTVASLERSVEFDDVTFAYDDRARAARRELLGAERLGGRARRAERCGEEHARRSHSALL